MPVLASLADEFKGVRFVALTVWGDNKAKVSEWMNGLEVNGVNSGVASDESARQLHALAGRKMEGIPATVFIAPDGTIRQILDIASKDEFRVAFEQVSK
jgi:hypothetical protein